MRIDRAGGSAPQGHRGPSARVAAVPLWGQNRERMEVNHGA
ncbi:hypothetical protein EPIB2_855 [Tritonibacter mobilis]|nr:hypothetical protein EPIB2_855 [Tritonibacter mobilis]